MTQADFDGSQVKLVWQLQLVFETELVAFGILSQLTMHAWPTQS